MNNPKKENITGNGGFPRGEVITPLPPESLVVWDPNKPPGGTPLHIPGSETPDPPAPKPQPEESPC